ncbi:FtsX-like permease family protein [Streptomyces polyrhachis]|uniref:FtsX-like permease family protein n=1 Tax=Streptomyces polyrhachis TaxID=1282885 RepID=A0ABW2GB07_9ACTN
MRATLRWAHSDLRTHRGEALFMVLATAGIVVSLLLATALFGYAVNPWQRTFTQARGAHIWIHTAPSADTAALAALDDVDTLAGPYRAEPATVSARGIRALVELRATAAPPAVGRPQLTAGRWPGPADPADPAPVVLERRLAGALLAEPGDVLTLPGTTRRLTVTGIADSPEPRYDPGEQPGLIWAPPAAVRHPTTQVVGLRLTHPGDTDYLVQRAVTALGSGTVEEVSTWQQARAEAQGDSRLLAQILGLFGLGALLAAAGAVHGAIATRIRGHRRDISVLKAIGFTPAQVVRAFLLQHLAYALLGALLGAVLIHTAGRLLPGRLGEAVGVWQGLPGQAPALTAIPVAVVCFIGVVTALAAWRAGRVPPVPLPHPAAPTGGGLPRGARWTLGTGLPPALVLGCHTAFTGRRRSLAAVSRLALPLLIIVAVLSAWTTLDRFRTDPEHVGLAGSLTARADSALSEHETRTLLTGDRRVDAAYPGVETAALVPGQTETIVLRGLGTRAAPYPYALAEGRPPRGPDEAIAGQGLLDLLNVRVGDWIRMTVGGRPQILHLVGRGIEPRNAGRVVSTTLDTLHGNDPALTTAFYRLRLHPGADPRHVAAALTEAGRGRLDVHPVTNPADGLSPLQGVLTGLVAVLALIALVELLTAIGGTLRESERDLLALKAIGMSPRQIAAVTVTATACTALTAALAATALGLPLARWLIDTHGTASGIGAGIARAPSPYALTAILATAILASAALAAYPATRAAHHRPADTPHATM